MEVYDIQKIQLASSWDRSALESLLQSQGLRLDHDVETAFGVYETSGEEPKLVGCGCDAGSVLGTVGVRGPVDYTVVQGRVTVEGGRLVTVDEARLAREADAKCRAYLAL